MKKVTNIKYLILGMLISGIMFGTGVYAATTYAISANKIAYSDNSSLAVDNVQAAIDGTCSKIDTRLNNIETNKQNKLITTTGNVTTNINTTYSFCSDIYKYGQIVMYNCTFVPANDVETGNSIFTIPNGYRPIINVGIPLIVSGTGIAYNAYIDTNGVFLVPNNKLLKNTWYQFSISFLSP